MKKLLLLMFAFMCMLHVTAIAQTTGIKGKLADTTDNKSLENAVISVLTTDTTLIKFSRADAGGNFFVPLPDSSKNYLLLVTHSAFGDYLDSLLVRKGEMLDLKVLSMFSKAKLLEEVIVRGNRSMFLRGDTTVFTADSFKVAEGANVEELLRKLPGFQVDRSGKITAMGENVKKVLVDGEEFFGSDPGIATKNLRADVVKEVEVYDRKSDQANFTGIDDGTRDKTVNLKLKEDKKKGYFGKIDAGGGLMQSNNKADPRYYGAAMINAFKAKRKIAAYGISSNTGFMNLDWDDNEKFGGGNNMEMRDGGFWISSGNWNSSTGIPVNYNAGLHYSNKFNEDKNSLNASYRYVQINAPGNTRRYSKDFANTAAPWSTNYNSNFVNNNQKHALNIIYETKLDSMNTLKLTTGGDMNFTRSNSDSYSESTNDATGNYLNKNTAKSNGDNKQKAYNATLLWMHKFKKEFRTLSISTNYNNSNSNNNSTIYSKTDFYKNNVVDSTALIDQQNLIDNQYNNFSTKVSYTEPLAKDFYMETSYSFGYNQRQNNRDIFAKGVGGNYDNKIDSLSNDFEFNDMSNSPGMSFRFNRKKINTTIGTTVGFTNYQQKNKTTGIQNGFHFINYFPRASFFYQIKPSEGIRFNYNGNTNAPSLEQMQPIRNNTNQLNQYIGNPDLRPSFSHSFRLSYNNWKMLNQRSIWASINGGFTQDAFTTLNNINANGSRTTQTVNANGIYNFNLYGTYRRLVSKKLNLSLGAGPEFSTNNGVDFISYNNSSITKNNTTNTSYTLNVNMSMDKDKKYNIYLNTDLNYNVAKGTISKQANAEYWSIGGGLWSTIYLPKEFELENNVRLDYRSRDPRFPTNNNFTFWDAELRKWFLKRKLQVKIAAKDILNQRNGYSRNFNSSSFTDTYNTVLQRHFLVGLVWNFNKSATGGDDKK